MHKFSFPITLSTIREFCHPDPSHDLHEPAMIAGTLHAGNSRIAIRSERGLWLPSDFPSTPPAVASRFAKLPWNGLPAASPEWVPLDLHRGDIFARGKIRPWTEKLTISPSPVWQVAQSSLIRLSHLQLLAMLPGAEIYAGPAALHAPIYVRFSGGGISIVPRDPRLKDHSRSFLKPQFHPLKKSERIARSSTPSPSWGQPPPPEPPLDNWPPIDTSET